MAVVEPRAVRWTRDDYHRIAASGVFEGRRVELIRGEVIEMTPQDSLHATGVTAADRVLQRLFGDGFVVRTQLPLVMGPDSEPEPDVAVVRGDLRDYIHAHPTDAALVVEVAVTSLEHDRTTKQALYADAGVPEYWIVNLAGRQLEVYRDAGPGGYKKRRVLNANDSVAPLACSDGPRCVASLIP